MSRSEIIALLKSKYNSSLYDLILDKLEFFGYEVQESDLSLIAEFTQETINDIKINCAVSEIPEEYDHIVAGAVVADFLNIKKSLNQLDISTLDFDAVASVSMGGTSVSYNAGDSDSAKFNTLIDTLKYKLKGVYPCLKKIRW